MKRINIKLSVISFILVLLLTLGTVSGCITFTTPPTPSAPPPVTTPSPPPTPIDSGWTPTANLSQSQALPSTADAVAAVKPSVVAIDTEVTINNPFFGPATQQGAGSGWILDKDGIIVTNNHVVEGAQTITVTLDDGRTFTVNNQSVYTDSLNDLAVLRIDAKNLPALRLGDSSKLRVGDWVIAIGNSLGQGTGATAGIVSRKGVSLPVDQNQVLYDLIQIDAAINPGNSGGPLINMAGEVIGITSAKIAQIGVEGMGYAISTDTALPIIQELVNKGYVVRPYLGLNLYTVDQLAIRQYSLKVDKGVLIVRIGTGGPAAQAGLKAGDVVVSIGGKEVADVQEFTRILHASKIGQPLEIVFYRGSTKSTVQVIPIESSPSP